MRIGNPARRIVEPYVTVGSVEINDELSEKSGEAREPFDKKVAASMAAIAAALAIVSVMGQLLANEELLAQQKSSDQWAYYQAKSIRRYESEIARDLFKSQSAETSEKYAAASEKYQKDGEEIQTEAKKLEAESAVKGRQALRLHFGEIFLEIGIVFASLAILTKRTMIWMASLGSSVIGIAIALTALTISG
jgi:hypothetical protein